MVGLRIARPFCVSVSFSSHAPLSVYATIGSGEEMQLSVKVS